MPAVTWPSEERSAPGRATAAARAAPARRGTTRATCVSSPTTPPTRRTPTTRSTSPSSAKDSRLSPEAPAHPGPPAHWTTSAGKFARLVLRARSLVEGHLVGLDPSPLPRKGLEEIAKLSRHLLVERGLGRLERILRVEERDRQHLPGRA